MTEIIDRERLSKLRQIHDTNGLYACLSESENDLEKHACETLEAKESPKSFGSMGLIGYCANEFEKKLMVSAEVYNSKFPEYLHWVIPNPRGEGDYGYYLVREKRSLITRKVLKGETVF